jgi:hypothetical protein
MRIIPQKILHPRARTGKNPVKTKFFAAAEIGTKLAPDYYLRV